MPTHRIVAAAVLVPIGLASAACGQVSSASVGLTARRSSSGVPLPRMVGQMIAVRMPGRVPTPSFLARIRAGQVGGVILFPENFGPAGPATLVARLQAAASQGGNPPLLIGIDQEGGIVKRLLGAPSLAPPQMVTPAIAMAQGYATARNLVRYQVNVDLAPVLDVGRGGFITPRTFGHTPATVATRGGAFARGLSSGGVVATAKHFPGLGYATTTTDAGSVVVHAPRRALLADLLPFRTAISGGIPMVMVSTALYPGLGVTAPAATSQSVVAALLRTTLGFRGVVITDALSTRAVTRYYSPSTAAVLAIRSGVDVVLAAGTTSQGADATSKAAYSAVLAAVHQGRLSARTIASAYELIIQIKQRFLRG